MTLVAACAWLLTRGTDEGSLPLFCPNPPIANPAPPPLSPGVDPVAAAAAVDGPSFADVNIKKVCTTQFPPPLSGPTLPLPPSRRFPALPLRCARYQPPTPPPYCRFCARVTRVQVLPSTCNLNATSCCFVPKAGAVCVAACDVVGVSGDLSCAVMLRVRHRQVAGDARGT